MRLKTVASLPAWSDEAAVSVEGRITTRPSMEESIPPQDTLVVARFIGLSRPRTCGPDPAGRSPR